MGAQVLDSQQKKVNLEMGCYGIGVTRLLSAVVESRHDEKGIQWPEVLAPYKLCIITVGTKKDIAKMQNMAESIYDVCMQTKFKNEIILDDRYSESLGVKLTEAELIGFPFMVRELRGFE
jgi:prolyl-tRNA synthetase